MPTETPEGWSEAEGALERRFQFSSFAEALAFVNRVGAAAEEADHHPDLTIHDYKLVTLRWRTHSAGAITELDRELARRSGDLA